MTPVFELEQHQVHEVLRILLHTIVFNRALGPVKPVERDSELFAVTWVSSGRGPHASAPCHAAAALVTRRRPFCPRRSSVATPRCPAR